jgi:hypothetical protein
MVEQLCISLHARIVISLVYSAHVRLIGVDPFYVVEPIRIIVIQLPGACEIEQC